MRSRFFWKIFLSFIGLIALTTVSIILVMTLRTEEIVYNEAVNNLTDKLGFVIPVLESQWQRASIDGLQQEAKRLSEVAGARVTFVDQDGFVVGESDPIDVAKLDNHSERPEIIGAAAGQIGISKRFSSSTQTMMLYAAGRAYINGRALYVRFAIPNEVLRERWSLTIDIVFVGIFLGCTVAVLLAFFLAKKITGPISDISEVAAAISRGNYDARVSRLPRNELGALGLSINTLAAAIQENINRRERVEKIRREFSSNASHELKTPLTSIRGYVETLLAGAIDDRENNVRFLDIILANINRMIALVNDLLRLSSIEANAEVIELAPVDWVPVIEEVIARHHPQVESKQIELTFDLCPDRFKIRGNSKAMSHILDNLLQNAINYTPDGGAICIRLRHDHAEGILSVVDTGIGIAADDQSRIFERFYRVDSARSRADGGTGLGLAIVKHLVLQLQGRVMVQSELKKGSSFSVALPLHLRRKKPTPNHPATLDLSESVS